MRAQEQALEGAVWQYVDQLGQTLPAGICSGTGEGMTLEEQKSKLADARAKAQGALARGDSGEASLGLGPSLGRKGVRGVPLGMDRDESCYWKLQAAEAFGG